MAEFYRTLIPIFEELRTEHVTLRSYKESDAQDLFEAVGESRDHIRPWLPFADAHHSVEESRDWIIQQMAEWLLREQFAISMWESAAQRYLGGLGLHPLNWESRSFEIGYWLRPSATGRGYVTEAVRALTEYTFTALEATRIEIRCDERNERSAAVPRRLGFVQEALLRNDTLTPAGSLRNTLIFARIPSDPLW